MTLNLEQIKEIIPHRDPFLLIDEVTELEPGVSVTAKKYLKPDEYWLHSVPVFSPAKIVKITERCGLRPESMHVWCDFLCCGREYPGLCACRLFFRLSTLLFSGCFYYLYAR